ncbi:MAG: DUF3142 domain-containing protein [Verrucomicrobiales bacterium]|nr:DUF3142 domain-containing protein [Verrucomicrobiales bacterium]
MRFPNPILLLAALSWLASACDRGRPERVSGPIAQEAYVWQREWGPAVAAAIAEHGTEFQQLTYLAGELRWSQGVGKLERVDPDYAALRRLPHPVGLALRVATLPGPFASNAPTTQWVVQSALQVVTEARAHGLEPSEFQLDFDCATRHLEGYRQWAESLRAALAPLPFRITVLPAWLSDARFAGLARSTDGFVLQVHSLERPKGANAPFALCDPRLARDAVERAARLGVPFRVALPTYGYLVAFAADGSFLGASAEGAMPARPPGTRFRELSANAADMAWLVADWTRDRPASMTGLIWYRLPVAGDRFNWRWPTLASVMRGIPPVAQLQEIVVTNSNGSLDLVVRNSGTDLFHGAVTLHARWNSEQSRLLAADAVRGFKLHSEPIGTVRLENPSCRLPPGDAVVIGWVRFDRSAPVSLELHFHPVPSTP